MRNDDPHSQPCVLTSVHLQNNRDLIRGFRAGMNAYVGAHASLAPVAADAEIRALFTLMCWFVFVKQINHEIPTPNAGQQKNRFGHLPKVSIADIIRELPAVKQQTLYAWHTSGSIGRSQ